MFVFFLNEKISEKKLYSVFLQHYILKIFFEGFFYSAAAFTIKDCRDYYTMLSKSPYI